MSRATSIVVASARAKSSPRVKLRLLSPAVDGYCRLVGPRETGCEQQTEQNQSAHESAGTLT
jgi:hypothetical protein